MTEPAPVPETLEQALDPAWLTLALQERHPGIEVTKVSVRTVDTRISTNRALHHRVRRRRPRRHLGRSLHQGVLR